MDDNKDKKFVLKCSYMEIYNENIFDLLTDQNKLMQVEPLSVQEDGAKGFHVKGLSEYEVKSMEEIM